MFFQLLAASIISFVALMAIIGSHRGLPISFGTPGLVCSSAPHISSTCAITIQFLVPIILCYFILFLKPIIV